MGAAQELYYTTEIILNCWRMVIITSRLTLSFISMWKYIKTTQREQTEPLYSEQGSQPQFIRWACGECSSPALKGHTIIFHIPTLWKCFVNKGGLDCEVRFKITTITWLLLAIGFFAGTLLSASHPLFPRDAKGWVGNDDLHIWMGKLRLR